MASCDNRRGGVREVSRNGKRGRQGHSGAWAGGAVGGSGRGRVIGIFAKSAVAALMLAAGLSSAHAETAAHYSQDQTHWVDPWQASGETQAAESEVPLKVSTVPTLSESAMVPIGQAILKYREIAKWGGWGYVASGERLEIGVRDPRVAQVRERLVATGDMGASPGDAYLYDERLAEAVRHFQMRNGLDADGIVGRRTIAAMNVPVQTRIRQLEINLRRIAKVAPEIAAERRYIFVNIAGQEVEAVNNGVVEFHERVIVGKQSRQTPEITSQVTSVTFNPYWYVPKSIAMADMLPKVRANPDYLRRQGIRVMQGWDDNIRELDPAKVDWSNPRVNEAYYLRQDPGPWNSLGSLKINFPNSDAIFLHDTPTKTLFGRQARNFSSGCVRVQNVRGLVTWLMQGDSAEWDAGRVERAVASGQYRNATLATPVPIFITYLTAWVDASGVVQFRDDVYDRDGSVNTSALEN